MDTRIRVLAALTVALALSSGTAVARADVAGATSELALPASTFDLPAGAADAGLALVHETPVPAVEVDGVHYIPRRSGYWGRHGEGSSVSQVHVGFYDPDGNPSRRFLLGLRGGPMIDSHIMLGIGADWAHQSDVTSSVIQHQTAPDGTPITVRQDLSRASTDFVPLIAFAQISADDDMPIIPFFGIGGGYEFMSLSGDDFQNNTSFDATYGGWGWQLWGGAAYPLSGRSRLTGELYVNNAELGRDVTDNVTGVGYRETVNANGIGVRVGIAWGF